MKKKLTAKQRRAKKAIAYLQTYMATYTDQKECLNYEDKTIIDDVLYGLGVALGGKKFEFAMGFSRWKAVLREHLAIDSKAQASTLTNSQFRLMDKQGRLSILKWREHLILTQAKTKDFELTDIPNNGRWLRIRGRGKSRTWKPEPGKVYLFKDGLEFGLEPSPCCLVRAEEPVKGSSANRYTPLWGSPWNNTHVWVAK